MKSITVKDLIGLVVSEVSSISGTLVYGKITRDFVKISQVQSNL